MLVHLALQKGNKYFMTFPSVKRQHNYNDDSSDDEPGNFDPVSDYESDDDIRTRVKDILSPKRQRRNNDIEIIEENVIQQEDDHHVQMEENANDREEEISDEEQRATMRSKRKHECDEVNAETAKHPMMRTCNCKMKKCHLKINDNQRELVHNAFLGLKYNDRRLWIYNHIEQYKPKRCYTLSAVAKIQMSRNYWLPSLPSGKLYVCKDMFLRTLGHKSDRVITTALSTTSPIGMNTGDKRGKHSPKHKVSEEDRTFLLNHIRSFKPQISHYRREHAPNRLYLPPELTMKEMYANYVEECRKDSRIEKSYVTYSRQIKDMNISFAKLGCEECEICDEHKIHMGFTNNEEEKFDMLETCERECEKCTSWKDHYAKYRETRLAYKEDKNLVGNYGNTLFLSADMQKVILLPRLPGYKICLFTKRIVVINQSFAPINKEEVNKKRSLDVLWHEGSSGRNDEDVTSAFLKAINSVDFRDFDNYVIWLDNCAGQNKNWTLYTALTNLVNSRDGPKSITLKYFVVGHTFMSADSFHHKVEGEMKKMKNVFDWSDFTRCVQKAGQIVEMDIQDFKEHESGLTQSKAQW